MDGFVFAILLFLVFLILMISLTFRLKGKRAVYLSAVIATLSAWFVGLILDANINFAPDGFLAFRMLLPILAMGLCILNVIIRNKPN